MQRRRFVQALAALSAAATARAQPPPAASAPAHAPALEYAPALDVATPVRRLFTPEQHATLVHLARILVPAAGNVPDAAACGAPELLDFVLSRAPVERQSVYTTGLDLLENAARSRYRRAFAAVDAAEADVLLEPLRRPWSFAPRDPLEQFLRTAQRELRVATQNSRAAALATGNVRTVRWLEPLG